MKILAVICFFAFHNFCVTKAQEKHLFILSGQSNMELLKPEKTFVPTLEKEFGKKNIIVVKDALGTQPISMWYKKWEAATGEFPENRGYLYDRLMEKVYKAIKNQQVKTITFIWMQGERDAKLSHANVYKQSLLGLYEQLSTDLKVQNMHFIIGRINDFGLYKKTHPDWEAIRKIQEEVANSNPIFDWVDTDDLNTGTNSNGKDVINDIHLSIIGYDTLGIRFAKKAIQLLKKN